MWRRAVYVVVVASLCLARQPSLAAWEKDTHYGLTLWLGLQAGFSLTDAKRVAELTQGDDEGFVTPATMTESIALLIGDVSGARLDGQAAFSDERSDPRRAGGTRRRSKQSGRAASARRGNRISGRRRTRSPRRSLSSFPGFLVASGHSRYAASSRPADPPNSSPCPTRRLGAAGGSTTPTSPTASHKMRSTRAGRRSTRCVRS